VFDTETGKQTQIAHEHKKGVNCIAYSQDMGYFITGMFTIVPPQLSRLAMT
jgi:hypothetical protein